MCQSPRGFFVHLVARATAYTWCGRKVEVMVEATQHPTCVYCIARAARWRREWPGL